MFRVARSWFLIFGSYVITNVPILKKTFCISYLDDKKFGEKNETRNVEHGTWNVERGTWNMEHGTRNVKRGFFCI